MLLRGTEDEDREVAVAFIKLKVISLMLKRVDSVKWWEENLKSVI